MAQEGAPGHPGLGWNPSSVAHQLWGLGKPKLTCSVPQFPHCINGDNESTRHRVRMGTESPFPSRRRPCLAVVDTRLVGQPPSAGTGPAARSAAASFTHPGLGKNRGPDSRGRGRRAQRHCLLTRTWHSGRGESQ